MWESGKCRALEGAEAGPGVHLKSLSPLICTWNVHLIGCLQTGFSQEPTVRLLSLQVCDTWCSRGLGDFRVFCPPHLTPTPPCSWHTKALSTALHEGICSHSGPKLARTNTYNHKGCGAAPGARMFGFRSQPDLLLAG